MGDNRDHSADSRADAAPCGNGLGGPVPIANIGGRAEFITFSLDGSPSWNPLTWFEALRGERAWTSLRPEICAGAGQANERRLTATRRRRPRPSPRTTAPARPRSPTRALRFEAKRALVWVAGRRADDPGGLHLAGAAGDLRRRWCSPRCSTAARGCSAGCCRSGAAGGSASSAADRAVPRLARPVRRLADLARGGAAARDRRRCRPTRLIAWLDAQGFAIDQGDVQGLAGQLLSGVGTVTRAIGGVLGALTTLFLIVDASASTSRSSRGSTSAASPGCCRASSATTST